MREHPTTINPRAKVEVREGTVIIDGARITATNLRTRYGIIHVIDLAMMP